VRIDRGALVISFIWQGQKCRERLGGLDPHKKENQKYAIGLKAEIEGAKTRGTFDYAKFFPESKPAHEARRADPTLGELIEILEPVRLMMPRKETSRENIRADHKRIRRYGAEALKIHCSVLQARDIRTITANMEAAELKPGTINITLANLRTLLDLAVEEKYLVTNIARLPGARLQAAPAQNGEDESREAADVNPFTAEEVAILLATAYKYRAWLAPYIQFSIYTGMRSGEKFALQWRDYDRATESILVTRNRVRGRLMNSVKTPHSRRRVDLCPMAIDALRAQAKLTDPDKPESFIFCQRRGRPMLEASTVSDTFRRLLKKAGLADRSAYQMRHTYATLMLMGGEDPLFVSRQLGHKDVSITYRYYARWRPDAGTRHVYRSSFASMPAQALDDPKVVPLRRGPKVRAES
jgi:integrase